MRIALAIACWLAVASAAIAQTPPAGDAEAQDKIVITGASDVDRAYDLFRQLDQSGLCQVGVETPRGVSCAQATYEVYNADGDFIRRCSLPIFSVVDGMREFPVDEENPQPAGSTGAPVRQGQFFQEDNGGFVKPEREGYFAYSFDRTTCGKDRKHDVALVPLDQLIDPRTSDGSSFVLVSIIGYRQAKEICARSKEHCVLELFDQARALKRGALDQLWPLY